jgi:hypothetical protein
MEHTYVSCNSCENWDDDYRRTHICKLCNNVKMVIDPKEVLCNLCGECMCPLGTINEQHPHGLHNAHVMGGYDSYHLLDMSQYTFSLCEKCLRQLFMRCKIKPNIVEMSFDEDFSTEETWERDQEYYEYRVWKDTGGYHQAYLNKKCNSIKDCPNKAVYTVLRNGDFTENCACEEHKDTFFPISDDLVKFIPNVLKAFL